MKFKMLLAALLALGVLAAPPVQAAEVDVLTVLIVQEDAKEDVETAVKVVVQTALVVQVLAQESVKDALALAQENVIMVVSQLLKMN